MKLEYTHFYGRTVNIARERVKKWYNKNLESIIIINIIENLVDGCIVVWYYQK